MLLKWELSATTEGGHISETGEKKFSAGELHIETTVPKCTIQKAAGQIDMKVGNDEKIFMKGYQTWTDCPEYSVNDHIRGLNKLPRKIIDHYSFDRYSDYHFVEYPDKKGILHGFSWCWFRKGENYRLFASLNEKTGYTMFRYNHKEQKLFLEKDCAGLVCEGRVNFFDLFYAEGSEEEVFDAWFAALQIKPLTDKKLFGYSSWYNRYQDISEAAIRQDLAGCMRLFEKGDLFQIDDGWEPFVGDWLTTDQKKFPNGLKEITEDIHKAGFKAGLWLAPFVAEEKSDVYRNHPDWFLKVNGGPWKAGCNWSGYYALDIDHPEVMEYLREVFRTVFDDWGFDLVKLDFLYAAAPYGNALETRAGRMYRAMEFLREVCGSKEILGCGVPVMPAFGLVEYCRISCDVSLDWNDVPYMRIIHRERPSTRNAVHNILSRRALNGRAYGSDPDVFFLREENCRLTKDEKEDLAKLDALLGNVFLTSDDPSVYTMEMAEKYRVLRGFTKAENVKVYTDGGIRAEFDLNGRHQRIKLFKDKKW